VCVYGIHTYCVARPIFSFAFLKAFTFEKDNIDDSPNKKIKNSIKNSIKPK